MSERDVDANTLGLEDALNNKDSRAVFMFSFALLRGFLKDVAKIADALEIIAHSQADSMTHKVRGEL